LVSRWVVCWVCPLVASRGDLKADQSVQWTAGSSADLRAGRSDYRSVGRLGGAKADSRASLRVVHLVCWSVASWAAHLVDRRVPQRAGRWAALMAANSEKRSAVLTAY